jgi:hypothetical protein
MVNSIAETQAYKTIVVEIVQPLVYLLFAVAVVYFIYGAVRYINSLRTGSVEGKESGVRHLLYGIAGLALMLSVFGIMNFIYDIITGGGAVNGLDGLPIKRPTQIDGL